MFTIPQPMVVVSVKDFLSDEVHVTGKADGDPRAVLSFVAVDSARKRVAGAPVAVVILTGAAFNTFTAAWKDESSLYSTISALLQAGTSGLLVEGVDIKKVSGVLKAVKADAVLAKV